MGSAPTCSCPLEDGIRAHRAWSDPELSCPFAQPGPALATAPGSAKLCGLAPPPPSICCFVFSAQGGQPGAGAQDRAGGRGAAELLVVGERDPAARPSCALRACGGSCGWSNAAPVAARSALPTPTTVCTHHPSSVHVGTGSATAGPAATATLGPCCSPSWAARLCPKGVGGARPSGTRPCPAPVQLGRRGQRSLPALGAGGSESRASWRGASTLPVLPLPGLASRRGVGGRSQPIPRRQCRPRTALVLGGGPPARGRPEAALPTPSVGVSCLPKSFAHLSVPSTCSIPNPGGWVRGGRGRAGPGHSVSACSQILGTQWAKPWPASRTHQPLPRPVSLSVPWRPSSGSPLAR